MNLRPWLAFAAILATATGCPQDEPVDSAGGDESGESGEPLTEVALEEFFAQAEEAHCAWQVSCHGYGTEARCKSVTHYEEGVSIGALAGVGSSDRVTPDYVAKAVEVGRIEYDAEAAAACLNYAAGRTCDRWQYHEWTDEELAGQTACLAVFTGRMGKNGPCASALECADGAVCGFDPTCTDMCCAGACRVLAAPIAVGQPCGLNPNVDCVEGSSCAFDPNAAMQVCTPLAGLGASCEFAQCVAEATCTYDGESFACAPRKGEGDGCEYYLDCEDGLECVLDIDFQSGECVRPAEEGEGCVVAVNGETTCRRFDNYCDPGAKKCVTLPGQGEPCQNVGCRGDFFCTQVDYTCSPVADEGEPCDYYDFEYVPCSGDHSCSYENDTPKCVAPSGDHCPVPADPLGGQ